MKTWGVKLAPNAYNLYTGGMAHPHPADDIIAAMRSASAEDREIIKRAYDFAEKAHGDEKRKSGEPYIVHPHAIAKHLAELGMDRDTIVAGILHDTTEDTPVESDEIREAFGETVAFLVDSLTKLSKLKYRGMERHVESLRRLLVATASDIRVIIIKMADRLHNMQTIEYVTPKEKRERITRETMEVYVPIAERLGMSIIKAQLEDLCFKTLEPEEYEETKKLLAQRRSELQEQLEEELKELKKELGKNGIRSFRTETRVKGVYSFARKLKKKGGELGLIYDLFAVRIVVKNIEDCYRILGVVHSLWRPIPGRIKDYIAFPKPNGYRSLHTSVLTHRGITVEVQIRTEEMHRESQYGVASHFGYKANDGMASIEWIRKFLPNLMKTGTPTEEGVPQWMRDLTEAQSDLSGFEVLDQALKEDFFAERMFVFTPKGDVIDLPVGATPVDFAYAIHSSIGDTMAGSKVNGRMVTLETPLKNGDMVEILTKKTGKPNKKWVSFAKTANAKKHIRSALSKAEKES